MDPPNLVPGLLSVPRITTLLASFFVAVGSGTNYVFSAYSPQLAARLNISHTQLNIVGLAANVGASSSGPFWGRITDTRGPRIPLGFAFAFLLFGYTGIRHFYDVGVEGDSSLSSLSLSLLIACSFMTGAGGEAAFTGAVNSTAKSFPDKARATTTGIVVSGVGLSGFFFSTLAHILFPGNTSSFLLLLSLGTALTIIIGFFLVRPIPLSASEGSDHTVLTTVAAEAEATIFDHGNDSHTPLLNEAAASSPTEEYYVPDARGIELGPPRSSSAGRGRRTSHSRSKQQDVFDGPNIYGRALWINSDFWLLFVILSLLSGTGLMYINNVGSMSQALFAKGNLAYDEVEASRWQVTQVSTISIMNFAGRIIIGLISDNIKNRFGFPRSYSLVLVSSLFFSSQVLAAQIVDVADLWKASALVGLSYGTIFGLFPTVCIEFFGLRAFPFPYFISFYVPTANFLPPAVHFSENWGFLALSPLVGGNLFSIAFGRNLDAHEQGESTADAAAAAVARATAHQCLEGRSCYVATLGLTGTACFASIFLSALAAWRERRKLMAATAARVRIVWEDIEN
ncbi:NmrA domain-containing protein [Mycena venus]|uniref:NmrA domain-containing protein n=1 Tax=Mycena venus TaxID=2733690 RepID=A0A8H6YZU2_9AGAR|nr:NmrA domain-containing protein [Mycena venus]